MEQYSDAFSARRPARRAAALSLAFSAVVCAVGGAAQSDERRQARLDEALKREGEALVRIADDAARGRRVPADFQMSWRNDFLKAQPGTFVPFTVSFNAAAVTSRRALMYVRVERTPAAERSRKVVSYPYETIFPLTLDPSADGSVAIRRGFAVPPGKYRVTIAVRERADVEEGKEDSPRKASVLLQDVQVPDFWTGELMTSSVILAERLEPVRNPVPPEELDENPYVIGSQRIHPAEGHAFARSRELIVVFLVYNPTVGPDKHFDVQVDYHLYRKDQGGGPSRGEGGDHPPERPGERYVTRTNPQRFNPSLMGGQFNPAAGAPVLAGQGILLSGFEPGDYRLGITVTDLLSRKSVSQDVAFSVIGS